MSNLDRLVNGRADALYKQIRQYSNRDITEKEFREPIEKLFAAFAEEAGVTLRPRDEYTLVDAGRADTVYNRLIIEYERPGYLRDDNSAAGNRHAIQQVKGYVEAVSREHRQKLSRLAGVACDGRWMIFVSHVNEAWHVEPPSPFTERNLARLLKLLVKTSTGVALIPENWRVLYPDGLAERLLQQLDTRLFQSLDNPRARRETLTHAKNSCGCVFWIPPVAAARSSSSSSAASANWQSC